MSWKSVALGKVANVGAGNSAPQDEKLFENGTHNFYRTSDVGRIRYGVISDALDKLNVEGVKGLRLHPKGTILFPKSGASTFLNHRVMLEKEGYVSSHLATIKAIPEEVDDKFLLYFLSTVDAKNLVQDSNYPSLKTSVIDKVIIEIPPLATQKKIVAKLDAIFADIDKATAAAETNAKNAEALFQSYLRQVFEEEGKEWQTTKVSELGRVQSGGTPSISKKEYWGNEIEWFSSGELNDLYTLASIRRITLDGIKNSNAKVFPINSLLIGMYDTAAMKMSLLSNPAAFNQAVVGIEPTEKINMVFLYYALAYIKPYVLSLRRGVRQKNLSLAKIKDLFIQIPKNIDIQNEVAERLNFFKDTTNKLKIGYLEKINQNIKLKNSILKQAFNGELVKE